MATIRTRIKENDAVELRKPVGDWPTGKIGAVVFEKGSWKLVEISDDRGQTLDVISVPEPDLQLVDEPGPQPAASPRS
jgi:hypothetical protein